MQPSAIPTKGAAMLNPSLLILILLLVSPSEGSELLEQLSFIYKDTYVVYGTGRRTERDLPVCEGAYEACSLAHSRPWLRPITERFCRCARRVQCPLHYEQGQPKDSQHVSNRAQLKFCQELDDSFETCEETSPALELLQKKGLSGEQDHRSGESFLTRTSLFCKCPWPRTFVLNKTTEVDDQTTVHIYSCEKLPRCKKFEACGYVRKDTYEMYYVCSCPENHLCDFKRPFEYTVAETGIPYFIGESYEAVCTSL